MTEKILAWHSDPDLKENTLLRMKDHAEQDRFIRNLFVATPESMQDSWLDEWAVVPSLRDWGGCLHGCLTAENLAAEAGMSMTEWIPARHVANWHKETERFFGIPIKMGWELDYLYENTTDTPPAEVAVQILEAIPVGADLSRVTLGAVYLSSPRALPEALEILRNAPVPGQEGQ